MTLERTYISRILDFMENVFEFAFDRKIIKKKISDQDISLGQHIVKIQLYDESTAYQTVYDIYSLFLDIKDVDKNKVLTQKVLTNLLYKYVSDQEDWERVVHTVKRKLSSLPKVEYSSSFIFYKKILDFIISLVVENIDLSRKDFYRNVSQILRRDHD